MQITRGYSSKEIPLKLGNINKVINIMHTDTDRDLEDYTITAIYPPENPEDCYHEEEIGSVQLLEDITFDELPSELEINGHTYLLEGK